MTQNVEVSSKEEEEIGLKEGKKEIQLEKENNKDPNILCYFLFLVYKERRIEPCFSVVQGILLPLLLLLISVQMPFSLYHEHLWSLGWAAL